MKGSANETYLRICDDFDLSRIARSGQCFRWHPMADGSYRIIHGLECVYAEEVEPGLFRFDCDGETFERVWRDYFDLDESYRGIRARIEPELDPFLWRAAECEKGIRILRQDPWEALVSFIISQNRNIPAICRSIELLATAAGDEATDARGCAFRGFPSPESVALLSQDDLEACKLGYRWKYVHVAARVVLNGDVDLEALKRVGEREAVASLERLHGVGPKVARCVALFGLHQMDSFPVDTWMRRAISAEYPGGYPLERYRPYNGVYQQYIFAYYRNGESG